MRPSPDRTVASVLARDAAAGDARAWEGLVALFDRRLRTIARGYRLSLADTEDVVQRTWLLACQHLRQLRDPAVIGAWLAVTLRREALRMLQTGVREVLCDDLAYLEVADPVSTESWAIANERATALHAAIARLPLRQRRVLTALLTRPGTSYQEIADELGMPIGSVGPTRDRGLSRLRDDPVLVALVSS
jgi:RNA polymerase sigma factor (sigma-70 family)